MTALSNPLPLTAQRNITESHRLLRAVLDHVPAMIGYWDRDMRNVLANPAYVDWFGLTPEQILGRHIREVLGEAIYALNLPYIQGALRGEPQLFDRTIVDPAGRTRYSQASYIPDVVEDGSVAGFFVLVTDVTARVTVELELATLREDLARRAATDPLTGLANRRELAARAALALEQLERAAPGSRAVGVLVLDLDGFKAVNDLHGHAAGDELLVEVAGRLRSRVRSSEILARLGGDEFVVLLPDLGSVEQATALARRLVEALEPEIRLESVPEPVTVGASVGVAVGTSGEEDLTFDALVSRADRRMYAAKRDGGNQVRAEDGWWHG